MDTNNGRAGDSQDLPGDRDAGPAAWVTLAKRLFRPDDGSDVWYGKVLCVKGPDRQDDTITPEEIKKTKAAAERDIADGNLIEMGENHEGKPVVTLQALGLDIPREDVSIGGETFHAGDLVIRFRAFGSRQQALVDGEGAGVSLEGKRDDSIAGKTAPVPKQKTEPVQVAVPTSTPWQVTITSGAQPTLPGLANDGE